tara:strand:- start:2226 stop:2519 length:294 start_codon:yes stop_codon:yes gene_type:complete
MDIFFVSHQGSMYRYFDHLNREPPFDTKVVDFSPTFKVGVEAPPLTDSAIAQGIAFQLQRKRSKYNVPGWVWSIVQYYYERQHLRFDHRFYLLLNKY